MLFLLLSSTAMTKKEYILTLLERLSGTRNYAEGLKLIVEQNDVSDTIIDGIYTLLSQAIHETVESDKKQSLEKSLELLQKIKHNDQTHQQDIDQEFDELLNTI